MDQLNLQIILRNDQESRWKLYNPVLEKGEIGLTVDSTTSRVSKFKIGDGSTPWNDLEYTYDRDAILTEAQQVAKTTTQNIIGVFDENATIISLINDNTAAINTLFGYKNSEDIGDYGKSVRDIALDVIRSNISFPVATPLIVGGIISSQEVNCIQVAENGIASVSSLDLDRIIQTKMLQLDGGSPSENRYNNY